MSRVRVVDWGLAERVAAGVGEGVGPLGRPASARVAPGALVAACREALEAATEAAGMGTVAAPPAPEQVGRRDWAANALSTLAEAAAPLERRLADSIALPRPLGALARRGAGAAIGAEAGLAAGYAARRVLGQYDVALFGPERPPRLLLLSDNIDALAAALGADRGPLLRWVAAHESAHVIQFERVPWLGPHLRRLAGELIESAAAGLGRWPPAGLAGRLRDPRALARAALRGELARALAEPSHRALLDRLQATMAVIEGHAEHVAEAAAAALGQRVVEIGPALAARRASRGGLAELLSRLLGLDLKLRQYELGRAFCAAITERAGPGALGSLWEAPGLLPDLAELERPERWLERAEARPARVA